jgi:sporulation protein YlmC with PRC-barrel domain
MRLGRSLIGNSVYGSADGRKLGEVKDLYLDDELTGVVGIFLGREGLLRPTTLFVSSDDISLFGIDMLLAGRSFTIQEGDQAPEPPGWLRLDQLRGREVRTPGGTKIGRVGDVALDEEARVTGLSLTNLSVRGPLSEADAIARAAVVDVEDENGVMTVDLAKAEEATVEVDPDLLFARPVPMETAEETEEPEPTERSESSEWPGASEEGEPYTGE